MAGVPGKNATLALGKQTAKGTPQTTPTYKIPFAGGDISGVPNIAQLQETDANRQLGESYKTFYNVAGQTEHTVRPSDIGLLLYATLGSIATAGAGADKTHTITPSASGAIPYLTAYKAYNGTSLVDRYHDLRITELTLRGSFGGFHTVAPTWFGLDYLAGQTDPASPVQTTEAPLLYAQLATTIGAATPGTVRDYEITISNGGQPIPGDSGLVYPDYVCGEFSVRGRFVMLFENDQKWRAFHTGSTSGTSPNTITAFSEALSFAITESATRKLTLAMANVYYTAVEIPPQASGEPFAVSLSFVTKRAATIGDNFTATLLNQVASY